MATGSMREKTPGNWQLRVGAGKDPITGKYRNESRTFRGTERQARRALAELVREIEARGHATSGSTVEWLVDQHLAALEVRGRSETTLASYRGYARKHIVPALGHLPIDRVTAKDLDQLYTRLLRAGYAASTVRQVEAILSGAFGLASRWDLVTRDPTDRTEDLPRGNRRIEPPTVEQVRDLIAAAEEEDPVLGVFVFVGATTGARRGELCALRWSRIDLDARTLTIDSAVRSVKGSLRVDTTKTHQERRLGLDDATTMVLTQRAQIQALRAAENETTLVPDPFVFSLRVDGDGPPKPELYSAAWERARKAAGLPTVRLHDLRHFVVTQALAAGHDLPSVAKQVGHGGGGAVTLRVYAHAIEERQRAVAQTMGNLVRPGEIQPR